MTRPAVGTVAWGRATGGLMNSRERLRMIGSGVALLLGTLPARLRQRLGVRNPKALRYDIERLPRPSSPAARMAEQLCEDAGSPVFLHHSHRTYVWGMLLGILGDRRPDVELLYIAALLHDLTLTDAHRDPQSTIRCFAARGGEAARQRALRWGWSDARAETLGDAISLHLNTRVSAEHGVEAQLLQEGAALDVIGHLHWCIAPETVQRVLARHPRLAMKREGLPRFRAVAHRGTRSHLLCYRLMFPLLVNRSQFDE